jgi:hypothetical protein
VTSAAVGCCVTAGCLLAIVLERDGFGRERDTPPRAGYVALLAAGALAGVLVPAALSARLLGRSGRWLAGVAAAGTAVVAAAVLGLR